MATDLVASRLLVRHAAQALDHANPNAASLASMAKLQATDKCFDVSIWFYRSKLRYLFLKKEAKTVFWTGHMSVIWTGHVSVLVYDSPVESQNTYP